jgi:diketogulonate reductase-like aldo/keto reductase
MCPLNGFVLVSYDRVVDNKFVKDTRYLDSVLYYDCPTVPLLLQIHMSLACLQVLLIKLGEKHNIHIMAGWSPEE